MRRRAARYVGAGALLAVAGAAALLSLAGRGDAHPFDPLAEDICIVAPPTPYDPASGQPMLAPRPLPAQARCPVCGMYPARAPRWAAQLIFEDGAAQFFDSPANLFIFTRNMGRYTSAHGASDVAASFVTDAASGAWIALHEAHFVHGSDAHGPMRDGNLPAFASRTAAAAFAAERGGVVLSAAAITDDILRPFDRGRHAPRH
jgi:nitrous oxide reductase accessory protein NosL